MFILGKVLKGGALGLGGCLILLLLTAVAVAINAGLVALIWNTAGLHSVFGAGTLSAPQCVAAGVVLGIFGV